MHFYPKKSYLKVVMHKNVTTVFLSMVFYMLDWDDYSWMYCGNTAWIFVSTDSTMQFHDEHWDENILYKIFIHIVFTENVIKIEFGVAPWYGHGLHHLIPCWTLRWKCPLINFDSVHDFHRKCHWMWCGNMVQIFASTDFSTQFTDQRYNWELSTQQLIISQY
jgi:hypothetical protein